MVPKLCVWHRLGVRHKRLGIVKGVGCRALPQRLKNHDSVVVMGSWWISSQLTSHGPSFGGLLWTCGQVAMHINWCNISTCAELVFQIHVQVATFLSNTKYWHGLPLTKAGAFQISFDISEKHVPWDPSGSL